MPRQNGVWMYAEVAKEPKIAKMLNGEDFAIVYLRVVRADRHIEDKREYIRYEKPPMLTADPILVNEIREWHEKDMVLVFGGISCKKIGHTLYCPNCKETYGDEYEGLRVPGVLVYVNPIHVSKVRSFDTKEECLQDLLFSREISNRAVIVGTLCRDPQLIGTANGLTICQYQIALDRKYRIASDPPDIKTDFPWVKSYGDNARLDKKKLHKGSVVLLDGYLQARRVTRTCKCDKCNEFFQWTDEAMEIVPFETEYMRNFYTDEEVQAKEDEMARKAREEIFGAAGSSISINPDQLYFDKKTEELSDE